MWLAKVLQLDKERQGVLEVKGSKRTHERYLVIYPAQIWSEEPVNNDDMLAMTSARGVGCSQHMDNVALPIQDGNFYGRC